MIYARIADGAVAELLEVTGDVPLEDRFPPAITEALVALDGVEAASVQEGWLYAGGLFAAPSPPPPELPSVPAAVTGRQARLALLAAGLLDAVETAIAAAPEAAQIEWRHGTTIERASPLLAEIGGALGLTDAQIDDLFQAAAAL